MDIINEINDLKDKINNELESLRYYKELSYICDVLEKEVNNYNYELDNEISLKKYKAFLEVFLENRISYINSLVINKKNESVFDNRDALDTKELNNLKYSISLLLEYIERNFSIIGKEIAIEYEKLNNHYENELANAIESSKRRFNVDMNISKEAILAFYGDTSSVLKSYINHLKAFKITHVDRIKIFVDNDIKVKSLFIRAYGTLKDERAIEAVKKLESNYISEINKCMESGSLYANTNILIVQENMIKNGLELDKIINKEKEKNTYYDTIMNMDMNYNNIDKLLEIENYVIKNNIFNEEFYKVLYFLVEKEKYFYMKYQLNSTIYNKISDKSKIILEKMFLNNIKDLSDDLKERIVIDLKKNGYFKVLDTKYKDFFDNQEFKLITEYKKEKINSDDTLECKYITTGIFEPHYCIFNKNTNKVIDTIVATKNGDISLFKRIGDIYRFSAHKVSSLSNKDINYYYDKDGKKLKIMKTSSMLMGKILNNYLVDTIDGQIIVDSNFNKIMDYRTTTVHCDLLVDYKKQNILVYNSTKKRFFLYDKDFNLIKEIGASKIIYFTNKDAIISLKEKLNMFNDGIVSILINDSSNKYICYYDILNDKKIDLFMIASESSLYGYNEGLYPYYEFDKRSLGYKNLNGDIVIKPNYLQANPFVGGVAQVVRNLSAEYGFINYQEDYMYKYDFLGSDTLLFSLNSSKYQYEVCYASSGEKYAIKTNNAYNIVSCEKIIGCDLNNNNDKVLKK